MPETKRSSLFKVVSDVGKRFYALTLAFQFFQSSVLNLGPVA